MRRAPRALGLALAAAQVVAMDIELWHDLALFVLVGAMLCLGELTRDADLATTIRSLHDRVWAIAGSTQDPALRRAAVASALRVTDWSPIWQPSRSLLDPTVRAAKRSAAEACHILAATAPEALRAIAEELLLTTEPFVNPS